MATSRNRRHSHRPLGRLNHRLRIVDMRLEDRTVPTTFTVTNLLDGGTGSLRAAISSANTHSGADAIVFQSGLSGTINLTTGELSITDPVTITGPGISISGNSASRILHVQSTASTAVISVTGLTFTGGSAPASDSYGGAIVAKSGDLNVTDCVFLANFATYGGAVEHDAGLGRLLTIRRCTFTGNVSSLLGGAIEIQSDLILEDSTLDGNTSEGGGAVACQSSTSKSVAIRNCTLSSNTGVQFGGALFFNTANTAYTVKNSTITQNKSAVGGGLAQLGETIFESSIVSGNIDTAAPNNPDLYTYPTGQVIASHCAIGSSAGTANFIADATTTSLLGANLQLGPLANNGGPTRTHVPATGSPVVNMGSNPVPALVSDQRGPGFARVTGAAADIGAVEIGQTSVVSNTNDSGLGSLRQAIINANLQPGAATVTFDPAVFASAATITLTSGELTIIEALTITGPGSALTTISGNNASQIFDTGGAKAGTVIALQNLTLQNGKGIAGGAIFVDDEAVSLTDCIISGCTAGAGGAIYVQSGVGSLSVLRCTIINNSAASGGNRGGALFCFGASSVSIQDTTISGNTAPVHGGGIVFYNGGSLLMTGSTLSGNLAGSQAGGLYFYGKVSAGGLKLLNSTISGNSAGTSGGGIELVSITGTLTIQNCTITKNTAGSGVGGGIARTSGTGTVDLSSTVVAGNTNSTAADLSFNSATTITCNTSLIGVANAGNVTLSGAGNLTGTKTVPLDAKLGLLSNNGGPTQTHLPAVDSPVRDKGSNPGALTLDQRGTGFPRIWNGAADIGAVELSPLFIVRNINDSGPDSLRQTVLDANTLAGTSTITFDSTVFASTKTITLTAGFISITDHLNITGPGVSLVTVSGNNINSIFSISGATSRTVTFSNMTLTKSSGSAIVFGDDEVTLQSMTMTGCKGTNGACTFSSGNGAKLNILDSTLTNNTATGDAGAVFFGGTGGTLTIRRSSITANHAGLTGGGIKGEGAITVEDSAVTGNSAGTLGGGAYFRDIVSVLVRNSTISGNSANNIGGIAFHAPTVTLNFQNSTITNNKGNSSVGGLGTVAISSETFALESTIASGNIAPTLQDIQSANTISAKNSAIGSNSFGGATLIDLGGNLPFGTNLKLGPLANNGGPTQTHASLPGSPLINAGSNPSSLTTDQRGVGFIRASSASADIGSFETQQTKIVSVQINDGSPQRSRVTSLVITFDQPMTLPTIPADAFKLSRQSDSAAVTLSAAIASNAVTLTFIGGPVDFGSLADGRYSLTALATNINMGGLDGNGDGTPGDNFVLVGDPTEAHHLFRLFGDSDGNGLVDGVDFGGFRNAFNTNSNIFDFDGSTIVDGLDFGQFRARFGVVI